MEIYAEYLFKVAVIAGATGLVLLVLAILGIAIYEALR